MIFSNHVFSVGDTNFTPIGDEELLGIILRNSIIKKGKSQFSFRTYNDLKLSLVTF